jgi:hypothetical protein
MNNCKNPIHQVYKIISWFDVFDYPLTHEEITKFTNLPEKTIKKEIKILLSDKINYYNDYYFLKGRKSSIEQRQKNLKNSKKLIKKINKWQFLFRITPFIKMTAICNTLALNNANETSDIDLFIITKKGRIFIARTIITFLSSVLGLRRHGEKIKERFCLSFFITENVLNFKKIMIDKNDIYLAYWITTLKPLFGFDTYQKFIEINKTWTKNFFRMPDTNNFKKTYTSISKIQDILEYFLKGKIGDLIEKKLEHWQIARAKKKITHLDQRASIIISKNMLKFHNIDMRAFYRNEWKKRIKN